MVSFALFQMHMGLFFGHPIKVLRPLNFGMYKRHIYVSICVICFVNSCLKLIANLFIACLRFQKMESPMAIIVCGVICLCCSVLQCVLQRVALDYIAFPQLNKKCAHHFGGRDFVCCSVLQCVAVISCDAVCYSVLQHVAVRVQNQITSGRIIWGGVISSPLLYFSNSSGLCSHVGSCASANSVGTCV